MKRQFRLVRSTDFQRVRRLGTSYAHPLVVLIALQAEHAAVRVGVAAGRTVGGAVRRNRAKRLLRAAIQPLIASLPAGWDLLLIARPPLPESNADAVRQALVDLLQRAHLLPAAVHGT